MRKDKKRPRCFQDKLALRCKANKVVIPHPKFVLLVNYEMLDQFIKRTLIAVETSHWRVLDVHKNSMTPKQCGAQSLTPTREKRFTKDLLFICSNNSFRETYHVGSLVAAGRVLFVSVERYGAPPSMFYKHGEPAPIPRDP